MVNEQAEVNGFAFFEMSKRLAGPTRLELATSCVTGRRSNQLNYGPANLKPGGRYRIRTCDSRRVKPVLYH
tara:strand:+ start:279 stop:491 length:213 start_codon:yes stop_codon:yes gene_type:complete